MISVVDKLSITELKNKIIQSGVQFVPYLHQCLQAIADKEKKS